MREWLKNLRLENSETQLSMSKKLDISESYYSLIENGKRQKNLNLSIVIKLAGIFNVSTNKIVEDEQKMKENS